MAKNNGNFIVIFRKLTKWEWYRDTNTKVVFLHCLLRANWKEGQFGGQLIKRGQFVTSYAKMAEELGLTYDQTRRAVERLNRTQEITHEKIPQGLIITVKNWDKYQGHATQNATEMPHARHKDANNRTNRTKITTLSKQREQDALTEPEELTDEEWERMMEEEYGSV